MPQMLNETLNRPECSSYITGTPMTASVQQIKIKVEFAICQPSKIACSDGLAFGKNYRKKFIKQLL